MNRVKWDSSAEPEGISNRLKRIFWRSPVNVESDDEMLARVDWWPPADCGETEFTYLINAEIPGVEKEDVNIFVNGGVLTFHGERKQEKEEKGKKFHRIERSYGSFARSFSIPDGADGTKITAEFKDGMLNITLAKFKKAETKAISAPML